MPILLAGAAEPVQLPVGETKVAALTYSPNGRLLAVGTTGQNPGAKVFDVATKQLLLDLPCQQRGAGFSVAFSPDGKLLAVADYNLAVTVRNTSDGAEVASLPGDPERRKYRQARRVVFAPDGKALVVGYSTGEVFVWDMASKPPAVKFDHSHDVTALAISSDGKLIATGTDFGFRLWNAADGSVAATHDQKSTGLQHVQSIVFSPDGKTLATADSPGYVKLFSAADGKEQSSHRAAAVGRETTIYSLALTRDGRSAMYPGLVAGLNQQRPQLLSTGIVVLDLASTQPRAFIEAAQARVLAVSPDDKSVAIATGDTGDPVFIYELSAAAALNK